MTQGSIDFDVAAREATLVAKARDIDHMRLGEIGANVKTIYGGKTLNKLSQITGIKYASLKCYVAVYRTYDSELVRRLTVSLAQALTAHPDRSKLLSDRPDMTVAEARKIMRAYKLATTVPKTSAQKLTAAWVKFDAALNPLIQLSAVVGTSPLRAVAIDRLIEAKDKLKSAFGTEVDEIVLPDIPDEPVAVAPAIEPASAKVVRKRRRDKRLDIGIIINNDDQRSEMIQNALDELTKDSDPKEALAL